MCYEKRERNTYVQKRGTPSEGFYTQEETGWCEDTDLIISLHRLSVVLSASFTATSAEITVL